MSNGALSLSEVNDLSEESFVDIFGGIAEHSPWVAKSASMARPYVTLNAMIEAFKRAIFMATKDAQLALIRAHPDLAGKAALAGDLTAESTAEQASAGLDSLTDQEFEAFSRYNAHYLEKFEFPFILAVKGATKHIILASFNGRLENTVATEFQTALEQISKIIRFRLEEQVHE